MEELWKVFEKTKAVLSRQGISTPRFYIRILVELEDFVNEQWEDKDARKAMSKANSKGLTTLRQKIRKYNKVRFKFQNFLFFFVFTEVYL